MSAVQKFVFDRPLGSTNPAQAPQAPVMPAPPPEAPVDEATIEKAAEAARAEGYAKGYAAGREEGAAQAIESAQADAEAAAAERAAETSAAALAALAEALPAMDRELAVTKAGLEGQAVDAAMALIRRLTPRLLRRAGEEECAALLRDAVNAAMGTPSLEVRTQPGQAEAVESELKSLADQFGFTGTITVHGDAALSHGAVHARWEAGEAIWDPKALRRRIEDSAALILSRLGDGEGHDGAAQDA